ncbi:hypothetical protein AB0P00_13650 [Microbacterium sp. NPDC077057]|uniref:hypothetical protein n=1 Tax=Microbacterium sp. NPDC077057 TaxID=3154763 RepID=UPI003424C43F
MSKKRNKINSLHDYIDALGPERRAYLMEEMASANGLGTGGRDLLDFIFSEGELAPEGAVQTIYCEMVSCFIFESAEVRRVVEIDESEMGEPRVTAVIRILDDDEATALVSEIKKPSPESSESIRQFARTLRYYESLFGNVRWKRVRGYIRDMAPTYLDDLRSDLQCGFARAFDLPRTYEPTA